MDRAPLTRSARTHSAILDSAPASARVPRVASLRLPVWFEPRPLYGSPYRFAATLAVHSIWIGCWLVSGNTPCLCPLVAAPNASISAYIHTRWFLLVPLYDTYTHTPRCLLADTRFITCCRGRRTSPSRVAFMHRAAAAHCALRTTLYGCHMPGCSSSLATSDLVWFWHSPGCRFTLAHALSATAPLPPSLRMDNALASRTPGSHCWFARTIALLPSCLYAVCASPHIAVRLPLVCAA